MQTPIVFVVKDLKSHTTNTFAIQGTFNLKLQKIKKMDNQKDKIRKFNLILNNEETSEIANFLFQLPLADFKFWGGLIQEAYEAKLQEGSGALEALKRKEIRKETSKLTTEIETLTKNINELTNQLSQEKREHNEKLKTLENELKQVRNEKDSTQVKLVSMELKHIGALTRSSWSSSHVRG